MRRAIVAAMLAASLSACALQPSPTLPACARPPPIVDYSFMFFFAYGSDQITPRAQRMADALTRFWRDRHGMVIKLKGYTDDAEAAGGDVALGRRRADAVAEALAEAGIPREELVATGYGATHPLVPTDPGVREPQNRRVEPVFHVWGGESEWERRQRLDCAEWLRREYCHTSADAPGDAVCLAVMDRGAPLR